MAAKAVLAVKVASNANRLVVEPRRITHEMSVAHQLGGEGATEAVARVTGVTLAVLHGRRTIMSGRTPLS